MSDVTQWAGIIESFLPKPLSLADREDLRQDLYVVLLEADTSIQEALSRSNDDARKLVTMLLRNATQKPAKSKEESLDDPAVRTKTESNIFESFSAPPHQNVDRKKVSTAVRKLPDLEKLVIKKLFYQNETEEEIAQHLGRSLKQVKKIRESALSKLAILLTKESHAS